MKLFTPLLLILPAALHAQVIINGSFESLPIESSESPATSLTDWSLVLADQGNPRLILGGESDFFGTTTFGAQYIALGGQVSPGAGVAQTVSGFTLGNQYELSFVVGNIGSANVSSLEVVADNWNLGTVTANGPLGGHGWFDGPGPVAWNSYSLLFTANASTLTFTFGGILDYPALDAVSLAPVPEPAEWALITGLGLAVFAIRRRRPSKD